jgi:glutathione S-transferase
MAPLQLIIGNKAYSSWSLRPWLLLRHAGIAFTEIRLPLYTTRWHETIGNYSPTGKVPVLVDGSVTVWESLAICEYLADKFPDRGFWPSASEARAVARSISAEMHSGFAALRTEMPMNMRRRNPGTKRTSGVRNEIDRIVSIWNDVRSRFGDGGPFLFGDFSIADAMYAPIVSRFATYAVELEGTAARYAQTILKLPALHAWYSEAQLETEVIASYEL